MSRPPLGPLTRLIVAAVEERKGVDFDEILGRSRRARIVYARQLAYWALDYAGVSASEAGRQLDRDHSTVLSGLAKIHRRIRTEEDVVADVVAIGQSLGWLPTDSSPTSDPAGIERG